MKYEATTTDSNIFRVYRQVFPAHGHNHDKIANILQSAGVWGNDGRSSPTPSDGSVATNTTTSSMLSSTGFDCGYCLPPKGLPKGLRKWLSYHYPPGVHLSIEGLANVIAEEPMYQDSYIKGALRESTLRSRIKNYVDNHNKRKRTLGITATDPSLKRRVTTGVETQPVPNFETGEVTTVLQSTTQDLFDTIPAADPTGVETQPVPNFEQTEVATVLQPTVQELLDRIPATGAMDVEIQPVPNFDTTAEVTTVLQSTTQDVLRIITERVPTDDTTDFGFHAGTLRTPAEGVEDGGVKLAPGMLAVIQESEGREPVAPFVLPLVLQTCAAAANGITDTLATPLPWVSQAVANGITDTLAAPLPTDSTDNVPVTDRPLAGSDVGDVGTDEGSGLCDDRATGNNFPGDVENNGEDDNRSVAVAGRVLPLGTVPHSPGMQTPNPVRLNVARLNTIRRNSVRAHHKREGDTSGLRGV
jgi:hypothetical protein